APNPAAPNPAIPNPAAPNPAVPNPGVPNPIGPNPAAPNPAAPNPAAPNPAAPLATAPVSSVPTTNPGPIVRDYDVKPYHCTVEDASFADVSKRIYGSEKYGKALQLFNRAYPMGGDFAKQDSPRLQAKQVVFWPPPEVL